MKDITVSFGREGRMNKNKEVQNNVFIKFDVNFRDKQLAELKGAPLSVFICLALHMNEDGECWLSNNRIMMETGYGEESVREAKKFLVEKGYLQQGEQKRWTKDLVKERFPKNYKQKIDEINFGTWAPADYKLFPETTGWGLTEDGGDRAGDCPSRTNTPDKEEPSLELEPSFKEEPSKNNSCPIYSEMENKWPGTVKHNQLKELLTYKEDGVSEEMIIKSIEMSADKKFPFGYAKGILNNCLADEITDVSDMEKGDKFEKGASRNF